MSRHFVIAITLLLLSACHSEPHYVGVGDVAAIDADGVAICHDAIDGLMPAGTSRFDVGKDELRSVLTPGTRVRFELERAGEQWRIARATALAGGNPGVHDHTPQHGGVVLMVGMTHLEAKATSDGRVQLYLTDVWRRPLPVTGVEGKVTLDLPDGKRTLPLVAEDGVLEAQGPPLTAPSVHAAVAVEPAGGLLEASFVLPLGTTVGGAAGIPSAGCVAPPATGDTRHQPRCVIQFPKPIAAVATSADATNLLVGAVDLGVSVWRLPAAQFALGFSPPSAALVAVAEPPHAEIPRSLAVSPNGREAVVAFEDELVCYAMDTGRVQRSLNSPGGNVRAVAWSPDGRALLVVSSFNTTASLLDAAEGRVLKRFVLDGEGASVAFDPAAPRAAVGTDSGMVRIFEVESTLPRRTLLNTRQPVRALAFVGDRLLIMSDDGVVVSSPSGVERKLGSATAMAANVERGVVATAGPAHEIVLTRLKDGSRLETLTWHSSPVTTLAWAGSTLISGDDSGHVALWDVPDAPRDATPGAVGTPTPT